jgi:hypothetical protein
MTAEIDEEGFYEQLEREGFSKVEVELLRLLDEADRKRRSSPRRTSRVSSSARQSARPKSVCNRVPSYFRSNRMAPD